MAAVPHFDMKPGERLKALREVPVNVEHLLGKLMAGAPTPDVLLCVRDLSKSFTTRNPAGSARARNAGACRRRRQFRHQAWRMPWPCRRERLRQDDGQQDPDARPDARYRRGDLQRGDGPIDVLTPRARSCGLRTQIQMVFQDPVSSLSPRMTVQNILSEPLEIHDRGDARPRLKWSSR